MQGLAWYHSDSGAVLSIWRLGCRVWFGGMTRSGTRPRIRRSRDHPSPYMPDKF